jgi:hypothetical protein
MLKTDITVFKMQALLLCLSMSSNGPRCQFVSTRSSYTVGPHFKYRPRGRLCMTGFRDFPQFPGQRTFYPMPG